MSEYLEHHGILGQKWGVRRFQNKDGSLTQAGKARQETYSKSKDLEKKRDESFNKMLAKADEIIKNNKQLQKSIVSTKNVDDEELLYMAINDELSPNSKELKEFNAAYDKYWDDRTESRRFNSANKKEIAEGKKITDKIVNSNKNVNANSDTVKKVAKVGGAIAVAAIAAYGGYKLSNAIKTKSAEKMADKGNAVAKLRMKNGDEYRVLVGKDDNYNKAIQGILNQMTQMAATATNLGSISKQQTDYTQDLLKKHAKTLSNYTMSDLGKMDLY